MPKNFNSWHFIVGLLYLLYFFCSPNHWLKNRRLEQRMTTYLGLLMTLMLSTLLSSFVKERLYIIKDSAKVLN